jgi:energy-coupling factor transporter ATP-binding protein EcfA2
VPFDV